MIEISRIIDVLNYTYNLKAVIFDLDDTLFDEKEYVKSGYNAVAKELTQVDNCKDKLLQAFKKGKPAIDTVLYEEEIFEAKLKERCLRIYREHMPTIHLSNETVRTLEVLSGSDIKLGLITDGRPEGQRAKIKSLQLENFFSKEHIVITDELGGINFRKPNPRAFCLLQEKFNVQFNEMVYVADNIEKDFIAPNKLGMKSIWYKNKNGLYYKKSFMDNYNKWC
ncbi:MAG: HAD hydrolase-like protein [Bacillota bacterium]|nr:HAD hydrolase-like protein [Bacillota bacterium]